MNVNPLVSIYIPTKNRFSLLKRAVDSCLQQSYRQLEVLIVDDGSDDDCRKQIAALATSDQRIRLLRQQTSAGAPAARNSAIAAAQGDFLTGLDDDDEFGPERVADFVAAAVLHPHIDFFCTGYQYILPSGRQIRGMNKPLSIRLGSLLRNNIVGNQIFAPTALFRQAGGFDVSLQACQDYDLWVRLCALGKTGLRLNNLSYIVHQEHEHERISTRQRRQNGHQQFIDKHRSLLVAHQCLADQQVLQALLGTETNLFTLLQLAPLRAWPLVCKNRLVTVLAAKRSNRA